MLYFSHALEEEEHTEAEALGGHRANPAWKFNFRALIRSRIVCQPNVKTMKLMLQGVPATVAWNCVWQMVGGLVRWSGSWSGRWSGRWSGLVW